MLTPSFALIFRWLSHGRWQDRPHEYSRAHLCHPACRNRCRIHSPEAVCRWQPVSHMAQDCLNAFRVLTDQSALMSADRLKYLKRMTFHSGSAVCRSVRICSSILFVKPYGFVHCPLGHSSVIGINADHRIRLLKN